MTSMPAITESARLTSPNRPARLTFVNQQHPYRRSVQYLVLLLFSSLLCACSSEPITERVALHSKNETTFFDHEKWAEELAEIKPRIETHEQAYLFIITHPKSFQRLPG